MNFLAKVALAQSNALARIVPDCNPTGGPGDPNTCGFNDMVELGINFVNALIELAFIVAAVSILIGGFRMIAAAGNDNILKAAKRNITTAVIGLVIVLVAWVVINAGIVILTDCQGDWWKFGEFNCGA
jgi:hypothetical protein